MMNSRDASHALMKRINRAKVLNAIRVHSPLSRSEIAGFAALDKKSITNFVGELSQSQLVQEIGKRQNSQGRPFTLLSFHPSRHAVLGISIEPQAVIGVLQNLYGTVLQSHAIQYAADSDLHCILDAIKQVYVRLKSSCENLLGVGFAIPGVAHKCEAGRVWESINLPALAGVTFDREVARIVTENVFYDEASLSVTLAEKWFGLGRDQSAFVCLDLGIGVGAGIIHEGRPYRGAIGFAGEIGHVNVQRDGIRCRCGNAGCLEAYISSRRVLAEINSVSAQQFHSLREVDPALPAVRAVLSACGAQLGLAMSYILNLICPPLFVLNGDLARFHEIIMPEIWRALNQHSLAAYAGHTNVMVSTLENAAAMGAASLVLSDIFEVRGHYYV
jgi:N-acetylglucosamine repressor